MVGIEPMSSGRAAGTLKHEPISPASTQEKKIAKDISDFGEMKIKRFFFLSPLACDKHIQL